jgi:hypothetical protein
MESRPNSGTPGNQPTDFAGFEARLLDHKSRFFQGATFPYPPPARDPCRGKVRVHAERRRFPASGPH